jgi:hypothetical protein
VSMGTKKAIAATVPTKGDPRYRDLGIPYGALACHHSEPARAKPQPHASTSASNGYVA